MAKSEKPLISKSGKALTPEVLDALAAEAERGYDLCKAKRVLVGRPSLGGGGVSPRLSFRMTPEIYDAARRRAAAEDRTISELAREAIVRYVES